MATPSQTPSRPARITVHPHTPITLRSIRCHSPSFRRYVGSRAEGPGYSLIPSPPSSSSSSQSSSPPNPASTERSSTVSASPPELFGGPQTTKNALPISSTDRMPNAFSIQKIQLMIPTPPPSPLKCNAGASDPGKPLYVNAHFAEPCTVGCLAHILYCGHKVYTTTVEPCANNCNPPSSPSSSSNGSHRNVQNPRTDNGAFICPVCVNSFIEDGFRSSRITVKSIVTKIGKQDLGPLPLGWIQESIPLCSLMDQCQFRKRIQELGRCCHAILNEHSGLGIDLERFTATGCEPARDQKPEVVERRGRPPVFVRKTPALGQVIEQLRSVKVEHEKARACLSHSTKHTKTG